MYRFLECTSSAIIVSPLSSFTSNMNGKKGQCMSKECERYTWYIYTPSLISHMRNGTFCFCFLSETSSNDPHQTGSQLSASDIMDQAEADLSLLRSSITAIRATRLPMPPPPDPTMISIITSGGSVQLNHA